MTFDQYRRCKDHWEQFKEGNWLSEVDFGKPVVYNKPKKCRKSIHKQIDKYETAMAYIVLCVLWSLPFLLVWFMMCLGIRYN